MTAGFGTVEREIGTVIADSAVCPSRATFPGRPGIWTAINLIVSLPSGFSGKSVALAKCAVGPLPQFRRTDKERTKIPVHVRPDDIRKVG
jgi:hypothetical protein